MPKQQKIITMPQLRKARAQGLKLNIIIPSQAVPLFKALMEASQADSAEEFAVWALCKGLTSEEAVAKFDNVLNELTTC